MNDLMARVCDVTLPWLHKRCVLEEAEQLEARVSALEVDTDDVEFSEEEDEKLERAPSPAHCGEATKTWSGPGALPHCAPGEIGAVSQGQSQFPKRRNPSLCPERRQSRSPGRHRSRSPGGSPDPVPSPQVINTVMNTGAPRNLLKDLIKATRRAREGGSDGLSLGLVQMAPCLSLMQKD